MGAPTTTKSATFPFSMDPCVRDLPRECAALMVAAAIASVMLIRWFTHARCITVGCKERERDLGSKLL